MKLLPLDTEVETKAVLKKVAEARAALAEMKGVAGNIPNESILISTLALQEAKDSSAIENIITTQDELYQSDVASNKFKTLASKEVHLYAKALTAGYETVKVAGILTQNNIRKIQATIEENDAGYRKLPGTALKNEQTGEVVYTPPQDPREIEELMGNLEGFMNSPDWSDWDPLVKMAVIHHQFESIHPFYDGNGRTGRIINILYLVKEGLLNMPILYLSRYINQNKRDYYRLLQKTRREDSWEEWVLFMLEGIEQTASQTIVLIKNIKELMLERKRQMRIELPKIYSQDLLNNIFRHPYTKIDFVMADLGVSRPTATRYLEEMCRTKILKREKFGKESFYINVSLFDLLLSVAKM
ncbi:MAG: Fic family protein [Imperialibacter sp.]|uniref:Fic family protein n=1 Tax=Imperialibacter sp. TaxID=2038411 RepID=UPI0032EAF6A3